MMHINPARSNYYSLTITNGSPDSCVMYSDHDTEEDWRNEISETDYIRSHLFDYKLGLIVTVLAIEDGLDVLEIPAGSDYGSANNV